MVKNFIYISPQFPPNYVAFPLNLRKFGVNVFGLAGDWFGQLPWELQQSLTEYYRAENMEDYCQLLRAANYFKDKYGPIDRVESHTEYWLPVEGALREDLGVWGKGRSETTAMRRKSLMKEVFTKAGIAVAPGAVIKDLNDARAFVEQYGYPVILKPDQGVGAAGTFKAENEQELIDAFARRFPTTYFIEKFVEGNIFTFDGLTDHDGNIVYCNSLIYGDGIMEVVNGGDHVYYHTAREIPADLEAAGRKTVKAFDVREKFFHLEFFRVASDNTLLGLEVNIRPPGGLTTDMWNYADDIDLYHEWARVVADNRFEARWNRANYVVYISRKDHYNYLHNHEEIIGRYRKMLCHWERIPSLFRAALGDTGYLIRSPSLETIHEAVEYVQLRG